MSNLLFDFTLDKATQTVVLVREFDAELPLVWDAFTKPELLDQWWAPKPFASKTKFMNFEEGGRRFYAMVSPEGNENWQIHDFTSISPKTNFKFFGVFADKDENPFMPGSNWSLDFTENNGITKVTITIFNESLERLERMVEMGFKEGITMTLNFLSEILSKKS